MKEDFELLKNVSIVQVCRDFWIEPNAQLYTKSPKTKDSTHSLRLYPQTNSFCDFADGRAGGDTVRFLSHVLGISNWQAAEMLRERYGLSRPARRPRAEVSQWERSRLIEQEVDQAFNRMIRYQTSQSKARLERLRQQADQEKPFSDRWCRLILAAEEEQRLFDTLLQGISKDYASKDSWQADVLELLARREAAYGER